MILTLLFKEGVFYSESHVVKHVTKGCIYYINAVKPYKFMDLQTKYPTNIPPNAVRLGASLTLS